jgi:hypothetical protein
MQTPPSDPFATQKSSPANSRTVAPRRGSPLRTFGCGCGGFLLLIAALLFARARLGRNTIDTSGLAGSRTFASRANSQSAVPSQDQMRQLAKDTLLDFSNAVQKKDFSAFHATVATEFAQEFSPEQMLQAFRTLIDKQSNLAAIQNASVIFQPGPSIDERGVLNLAGFFPLQPQPVYFRNRYVWQDAQWKLAAIDVQLGAPVS